MTGDGIKVQKRAFAVVGKAAVILTLALCLGSIVALVVMGAVAAWR